MQSALPPDDGRCCRYCKFFGLVKSFDRPGPLGRHVQACLNRIRYEKQVPKQSFSANLYPAVGRVQKGMDEGVSIGPRAFQGLVLKPGTNLGECTSCLTLSLPRVRGLRHGPVRNNGKIADPARRPSQAGRAPGSSAAHTAGVRAAPGGRPDDEEGESASGPATPAELWARKALASGAARSVVSTEIVIGGGTGGLEDIARGAFKDSFKERFDDVAFLQVRTYALQQLPARAPSTL